ncbi:protein kinase domain-containing protein [Actinomadura macrotermitis]|uniref:Protein kinase domain-containing protein n=1 Tax=Actinomadura macrotermitis TaxID=2585200 RepID=A0A7K0BXE8_9ACTN|nr:serine/threonine protein kinase [Actinomadura macrotermitis]MQY05858.1 hypothetical protein [Actinomadura macrotermitis]
MKLGTTVNGYLVTSRPCNDDAGKCVWAFAERAGKPYFIKRFLEPKRPRPDSTASTRSQELRMQECAEFERRHLQVGGLLRQRHGEPGSGNLVIPLDFFVVGSTYYKVTEKVEVAEQGPETFDAQHKLVLLRTLGLSLRLLHAIGVVHGDLKPTNVLIERKPASAAFHPAKLIDFDDAYVSGEPPPPGVVGGDQLFGSPEWLRYMKEDPRVRRRDLTVRSDMFSMGLMTHHYLTQRLPSHDPAFGSPAEAVAEGAPLEFDPRLAAPMRELLGALASTDPRARPDIDEFLSTVKDTQLCELGPGAVPGAPGRAAGERASGGTPAASARPSRLRMTSFGTPTPPVPPTPKPSSPPARGSRLHINLGDDRP